MTLGPKVLIVRDPGGGQHALRLYTTVDLLLDQHSDISTMTPEQIDQLWQCCERCLPNYLPESVMLASEVEPTVEIVS